MAESFKSGVVKGLLVWSIGFLIALITHITLGWEYAHVPPSSAIPILMTIVVGMFRLAKNLTNILRDNEKGKNKGEIVVHISFLALIVLSIAILAMENS